MSIEHEEHIGALMMDLKAMKMERDHAQKKLEEAKEVGAKYKEVVIVVKNCDHPQRCSHCQGRAETVLGKGATT